MGGWSLCASRCLHQRINSEIKSSNRANEVHIISFSHANEARKPALKEAGSCSGTSTHRLLDPVVLRMVETGVQDSGAKEPPSMIYWLEWAREENPGEDLAMEPQQSRGSRRGSEAAAFELFKVRFDDDITVICCVTNKSIPRLITHFYVHSIELNQVSSTFDENEPNCETN